MKPNIAVFIPAYGISPYLEQAITSVIESSKNYNVTITVVDDGSPTCEIKKITDKFSGRIKYLKNSENLGIGKNFAFCHELSESDLTIIMGSDDMLMENSIDQIMQMFDKYPNAVLYQLNPIIIDKEGEAAFTFVDKVKKLIFPSKSGIFQLNSKSIIKRLALGNFMYFPAIAWNNKFKSEIKWNTNLKLAIDLDLLFKLCMESQNSFVFTSFKSFKYRRHKENYSEQLFDQKIRIKEEINLHSQVFKSLKWSTHFTLKLLIFLAPTVRIHGFSRGLRKIFFHPKLGTRLIVDAMNIDKFKN